MALKNIVIVALAPSAYWPDSIRAWVARWQGSGIIIGVCCF
jgi:hypothetical protein